MQQLQIIMINSKFLVLRHQSISRQKIKTEIFYESDYNKTAKPETFKVPSLKHHYIR